MLVPSSLHESEEIGSGLGELLRPPNTYRSTDSNDYKLGQWTKETRQMCAFLDKADKIINGGFGRQQHPQHPQHPLPPLSLALQQRISSALQGASTNELPQREMLQQQREMLQQRISSALRETATDSGFGALRPPNTHRSADSNNYETDQWAKEIREMYTHQRFWDEAIDSGFGRQQHSQHPLPPPLPPLALAPSLALPVQPDFLAGEMAAAGARAAAALTEADRLMRVEVVSGMY
jgi:hypothetical protein